jgi:hypothetical protein
MVIDIELGRENYGSIPRNCEWRGPEPIDDRTDSRIKVVKAKKKIIQAEVSQVVVSN